MRPSSQITNLAAFLCLAIATGCSGQGAGPSGMLAFDASKAQTDTSTSPGASQEASLGFDASTTPPDTGLSVDTGQEANLPFDAAMCSQLTPSDFCAATNSCTLDEKIADLCSNRRDSGRLLNVEISTMECGGVLAILRQDGVDTQTLYLFDPSTKNLVEVASGANGFNECIASVSGVPLATSCLFVVGYGPFGAGPGTFGFRDACPTDGGMQADADADARGD